MTAELSGAPHVRGFCWIEFGPEKYAVGLEMSRPGGACYWAPEIPSAVRLAGPTQRKCELVHDR